MKALLCHAYGPIDQLRLEDVPTPEPGPGQVRVEVRAASVNFPDVLIVQGLYQFKPPLPFAPGIELAGVVSAVGDGVTRHRVGDRVAGFCGHGAFAEQAVVAQDALLPLPEAMDFATGSAFTVAHGTSLHALESCARIRAGETLVVLGAAGGVGSAAIELGKLLGARVIAVASSEAKRAFCRSLGADETIGAEPELLRRRVEALCGGRGADVVYDAVGGAASEAALRALGWRGRHLVVGFASGDIPKLPLNLALLGERSIVGVFWGEAVKRDPVVHAGSMRRLAEWFGAGRLHSTITERMPLTQGAAAIQRLAGREVIGKIVVEP